MDDLIPCKDCGQPTESEDIQACAICGHEVCNWCRTGPVCDACCEDPE